MTTPDKSEFNIFMECPKHISIESNAVLDEVSKNWTVTMLLMGNGFSFSEVKPIAKGKVGETEAKKISDLINDFQKRYNTMIEALRLCLPDEIESNEKLDDYTKFTLLQARKVLEDEGQN